MIIGIDPGSQGGIAFLGKSLTVFKMPVIKIKNGKKTETHLSISDLKRLLLDSTYCGFEAIIYVEDVHSIFGVSASANFKMGYNLGMLHSLLDDLYGDYYLVQPKEWQKKIWTEQDYVIKENGRKDTKKTSLNAAQRIFPNEPFLATDRSSVPHDGMFDAALIAYYGSLL